MVIKILKIVLDAVISFAVLYITTILLAWVGGVVFGTVKGTDGKDYGNYNSGVLIAISFALTIVFAVWFYKFLNKKSRK